MILKNVWVYGEFCLCRKIFILSFLSFISKVIITTDERLSHNNDYCEKIGHFLSAKFDPLKYNLLVISVSIIYISVRILLPENKISVLQYLALWLKESRHPWKTSKVYAW